MSLLKARSALNIVINFILTIFKMQYMCFFSRVWDVRMSSASQGLEKLRVTNHSLSPACPWGCYRSSLELKLCTPFFITKAAYFITLQLLQNATSLVGAAESVEDTSSQIWKIAFIKGKAACHANPVFQNRKQSSTSLRYNWILCILHYWGDRKSNPTYSNYVEQKLWEL